jgi:hypothetical protein
LIDFAAGDLYQTPGPINHARLCAFTELRERRAAESVRLNGSAQLVTEAIRAAEAEGNESLVLDLLRVKQAEAWRRHNRRIDELTELDAELTA